MKLTQYIHTYTNAQRGDSRSDKGEFISAAPPLSPLFVSLSFSASLYLSTPRPPCLPLSQPLSQLPAACLSVSLPLSALSTCLSVCLSTSLPVCLSHYLSLPFPPACLSLYLSPSLSVSTSLCPFHLPVCLSLPLSQSVCLTTSLCPFYLPVCLSHNLSLPLLSVCLSLCLSVCVSQPSFSCDGGIVVLRLDEKWITHTHTPRLPTTGLGGISESPVSFFG